MTPEQLERLRRAASGPMVANTQIRRPAPSGYPTTDVTSPRPVLQMPSGFSGILSQQSAPTTTNTSPPPGRKTLGERATGLLSQIGRAIYGDDEITRLRRQSAFQAMTLSPNQALITSNAAQIKNLQDQELLRKQASAFAEYLRGEGRYAEADLVERNPEVLNALSGQIFGGRAYNSAPQVDPKTGQIFYTRLTADGTPERIDVPGAMGLTAEQEATRAAEEAALVKGYERIAQEAADFYAELQRAAVQASQFRPKLVALKQMAEQVNTGLYQDAFLTAKMLFGVDVNDQVVLNAELMGLAQDILNQQTGTKTDFDFQVAVAQSASLDKPQEANIKLINAMIKRQEEAMLFGDQAREVYDPADPAKLLEMRFSPTKQDIELADQGQVAVEGSIVRNDETGEELILRNGQWVPYTGVE